MDLFIFILIPNTCKFYPPGARIYMEWSSVQHVRQAGYVLVDGCAFPTLINIFMCLNNQRRDSTACRNLSSQYLR